MNSNEIKTIETLNEIIDLVQDIDLSVKSLIENRVKNSEKLNYSNILDAKRFVKDIYFISSYEDLIETTFEVLVEKGAIIIHSDTFDESFEYKLNTLNSQLQMYLERDFNYPTFIDIDWNLFTRELTISKAYLNVNLIKEFLNEQQ